MTVGRLPWFGLAILSSAAFGMSGTFVKPLFDAGWTPGAGSLVRTAAAGLLLTVPTIRALRGRWSVLRRTWIGVIAFGALGIAGTQTAYFTAVSRIPVGTALMTEYLAPVLLVTVTALRLRRMPPARVLAGGVLAMAGLALVLDVFGGVTLDPIGLTAALVAAVVCAVYFQLSATLAVPPIALAGLGFWVATATSLLLGVTGLVPVQVGAWTVQIAGSPASAWVSLTVVVLVSTALAYTAEITAAARLGARAISFIALTEVLFAIIAAAIVLGQVPGPVQALGSLGLLGGVLLVISAPSAHTAPVVPPPTTPIAIEQPSPTVVTAATPVAAPVAFAAPAGVDAREAAEHEVAGLGFDEREFDEHEFDEPEFDEHIPVVTGQFGAQTS